MCVYFAAMLCAGRFGLGWAHDAFKFACHMFMHFHAYIPSWFYHLILKLIGAFLIVSLSFFLSLLFTLVASWHLSVSLLRPGTLFIPRYLLLLLHLTPLPLMFGSMMRRPNQTSLRTFHDATFIRNAKSFCQTSLTLTYPLSSRFGVTMWRPNNVPFRDYIGVLLQYARIWLLYSLVFYLCLGYTHGSYSRYCIRGTTHA